MKKIIAGTLIASILATTAVQAAPAAGRGGFAGFFVGCCMGLRTGMAWNDGKDINTREILRLIPLVNIFVGVWDGMDIYGGKNTADFKAQYPGNFF